MGVGHLWLVDPLLRTLEAYRRVEAQWLSLGTWSEGGDVQIEPFEAVAWPLGALWERCKQGRYRTSVFVPARVAKNGRITRSHQ